MTDNPARPEPSEAQRAYAAGEWCGECRYSVADDPPCCTVTLAYLAAHPSEAPAEVADYWRRQGAAEALRLAEFEIRDAKTIPTAARAAVCAVLRGRARRVADKRERSEATNGSAP